jgi:hypothetical protein
VSVSPPVPVAESVEDVVLLGGPDTVLLEHAAARSTL